MATTTLDPPLALSPRDVKLLSLVFDPKTIVGGTTAKCTATLDSPAPPGGALVALTSDDPHVSPPASVTISAGETSIGFDVPTTFVDNKTDANVTGSYAGSSRVAPLTLTPAVSVASVTLDPAAVVGSAVSQATIKLSGPAPGTGVVVGLTASDPSIAPPASVTVQGGSDEASASVPTLPVSQKVNGIVIATYGGSGAYGPLTVQPPQVQGLTLAVSSIVGGNPTSGTVTLNAPAPSGGFAVALSSGDPSVVVPASVTVAAAQTTADFTIATSGVAAATTVPISAGAAQATLTVQKAELLSVVAPVAWAASQFSATVNLNGMAPAGGTSVALSALTTAVTPPPSVTVAAGQTSATFSVQASAVTTSVATGIGASLDGGSQSAAVRLDPGLVPAPNGISSNPVEIDWSCEPPTYVTLSASIQGPAPAGGAQIDLTSHPDPSWPGPQGPPNVVIAEGQTSTTVTFPVNTPSSGSYNLTFTGEYEGSTA